MGVMIKGIRLEKVTIDRDEKTGQPTIQGSYSLISQADIVLAKQEFNGYNSIKLEPSGDTAKQLHGLVSGITNDLENILGLKEVSK